MPAALNSSRATLRECGNVPSECGKSVSKRIAPRPTSSRHLSPTRSSNTQPNTRPRASSLGAVGRSTPPTPSRHTLSMRSSWNGIQPTWLSAYVILMSWNRDNVPEKTQSHSEPCAFCAYSDIDVASGASGAVLGIFDDEPMCIDTVVAVSSHAAQSGSQAPEYRDGSPSAAGFSVYAIAKLPLSAHRRTSSAASSASQSGTSVSGMSRPWPAPPDHSSIIQSL